MNCNGLKRRRPFVGHDDLPPSLPILYDLPTLSSQPLLADLSFSASSPDQQVSMIDAEYVFHSPSLAFHHLSVPSHASKRPRIRSDHPYTEVPELLSPLLASPFIDSEPFSEKHHTFTISSPTFTPPTFTPPNLSMGIMSCMPWEALCSGCVGFGQFSPDDHAYHSLPSHPAAAWNAPQQHRALPDVLLPLETALSGSQDYIPSDQGPSTSSLSSVQSPNFPFGEAAECIPDCGNSTQSFPVADQPRLSNMMVYPHIPALPMSTIGHPIASHEIEPDLCYQPQFTLMQEQASTALEAQSGITSLIQATFPGQTSLPVPFSMTGNTFPIYPAIRAVDIPPDNCLGGFFLPPNAPATITPYYSPTEPQFDSNATSSLSFQPRKPIPTRRGPFKDSVARELTAQTRKIGSCIRCKMQRIRCDIDPLNAAGPCLTCQKLANSKIWRLPCLRYKMTDIKLNKPGQVPGFEWTKRWKDNNVENISKWASDEIKVVEVCEGFTRTSIKIYARRFNPQDGDRTDRSWVYHGHTKSVDIPPYAISDLEAAREAYVEYIDRGLLDCLDCILRRQGRQGRQDSLMQETYKLAWKLARDENAPMQSRSLLTIVFRLWMAARLASKSIKIVGDETLGMPHDILDETSLNCGDIPIPPVMGAQLDMIIIHHLETNLRRNLLISLQKLAQANQPQNWLILYLAFFILLHNAALLMEHDASYARKHGMKARFARENTVREYHLGANILLAYFHYCNKGVWPFTQACKDQDLQSLAELDDSAVAFVKRTRYAVERRRSRWIEIRNKHEYEDGFFFVSQLFDEYWHPVGFFSAY